MRQIIILLLLASSCSTAKEAYKQKNAEWCVQKIDSLTFKTCYIVYLENNQSSRKIKLLSRKDHSNLCDDQLTVNQCYDMEVSILESTAGFIEIGYRLGQYNIYENGILIFAVDDIVVSSKQVRGLCYLPSFD